VDIFNDNSNWCYYVAYIFSLYCRVLIQSKSVQAEKIEGIHSQFKPRNNKLTQEQQRGMDYPQSTAAKTEGPEK